MSPTLLLEKTSVVRPSLETTPVHASVTSIYDSRAIRQHEDARTGIQYRCECTRPDGKHEPCCILNLV